VADLSQVETALVQAILSAVYPDGISAQSTVGVPTRIYRGWPRASQLDADLASGVVNISVFPRPGATRNTTRMDRRWRDGEIIAPTMSVSVAGNTVTISGPPGVVQNVGIRTNEGAWAVTASVTDGASTVAANLRAIIPGAGGSGANVVMPSTDGLLARVGGTGPAYMEVRRQTQSFQVTIWAPTPALRDSVASVVDVALAQIDWLPVPDGAGTEAWMTYNNSTVVDEPSKDNLWRRDLMYTIEYPTLATLTAAQMLFGGGKIEATASFAITIFADVAPPVRAEVNVH
jgi:hypothetical protein